MNHWREKSSQLRAVVAGFAALALSAQPLLADTYTFTAPTTPGSWNSTGSWTDTSSSPTEVLGYPNASGDVANVEANITAT